MGSEWKPIETMPRDEDGMAKIPYGVVVGWHFTLGANGPTWWEVSTDELTDSATHWMPLPSPPENTHDA